MTLNELLKLLGYEPGARPERVIEGLTEDSRRVASGYVFVAAAGEHVDGHDFAAQAVDAGAVAVLGSRKGLSELCGVPYAYVEHPRKTLGILAHALAGDPSKSMTVIGITGTNGKSSSVVLTRHVLEACGHRAASFGTLGYRIGDETFPAKHTTPFGEDLAELFKRALDTGVTHVAIEASSHALDQERVAGIDFDVGVFTNLTQDHLDYHPDMDAYCRAKLKLFDRIEGPGRFTVVNRQDPRALEFINASRVPCYTFGAGGDCQASRVRVESNRTRFVAATPWGTAEVETRLLGYHNALNILGVIAVCGGLGLPLEPVAGAVATLDGVPGRFEHVDAGQDFQVIVDYAHTEDGLRNVLQASRAICDGRIILVFGCGGDRDKTKRPKMAAVAAELADFSVITSDNPRTEDPERIILDIESGIQHAGKKKHDDYLTILDRAEAIRQGVAMARPGDLLMIAGKGHENYQILGAKRIHFDDKEVAYEALKGN